MADADALYVGFAEVETSTKDGPEGQIYYSFTLVNKLPGCGGGDGGGILQLRGYTMSHGLVSLECCHGPERVDMQLTPQQAEQLAQSLLLAAAAARRRLA